MPELPEVEHVRRGLKSRIIGDKIIDVTYSSKVIEGKQQNKETIIKGISLEDFKDAVIGSEIMDIKRRSKYLVFELMNDHIHYIIGHLGMSGAYFVVSKIEDIGIINYEKHWHVDFELASGRHLIYSDIRRFGELRYAAELSDAPQLRAIAPEPFEQSAESHYLTKLAEKRWQNKSIKEVIMNHSVISGCGNIYACEALHLARIHPARKVESLTKIEKKELFKQVVAVLNEGIRFGGSSISSYRNVEGESGSMQTRFKIYGRKTCGSCGGPVSHEVIAARNTHYCENCQK